MKEEVKVPSVGESIVEGILMSWLKESGELVKEGDDLFELETEKASVTVPSPFTGVLEIIIREGTGVKVGQVVATIDTTASAVAAPGETKPSATAAPSGPAPVLKTAPAAGTPERGDRAEALSPAARRIVGEHDIDTSALKGTGKEGRLTKGDLLNEINRKEGEAKADGRDAAPRTAAGGSGGVRRVHMSAVRRSIATHLLAARHEAAHLTTFNEINMERVLEIRKSRQEAFEKRHGVKLGFMSFFVKASVEALREFAVINGRIEGDDIVYYDFYDIGVAVSTDRGLLVPVIRNADRLSFAELEKQVADLARRAQEKKISLSELQGGTFSITNGGIFGSLMSTPIPNHPQPAILGMHAIQERPVAVRGEVKIKPMMYVALTYDHRLIDGREAVSFLFRVKECVEDPERLLLQF